MEDKKHLVLDWIFDIPNQKLTCTITDDLVYEALEGGVLGLTKTYKGVTTSISNIDWPKEKFWISEHYGDLVGYYQPDHDRILWHPLQNRPDPSPNGVGPDGRYIDHLQRMQVLLEGEDCAIVGMGDSKTLYVTPNCGKTILKRVSTRDVHYPEVSTDESIWWTEHSQPCMMQPRTKGSQISSYDEMRIDGISEDIIDSCMRGVWNKPPHPELQKYYIYPSV